jgi:hypothetical protein
LREINNLFTVLFPKAGCEPEALKQFVASPSSLHLDAWMANYSDVPFSDPNSQNLVAQVSTKVVKTYAPAADKTLLNRQGQPLKIMAVDVGMVRIY